MALVGTGAELDCDIYRVTIGPRAVSPSSLGAPDSCVASLLPASSWERPSLSPCVHAQNCRTRRGAREVGHASIRFVGGYL